MRILVASTRLGGIGFQGELPWPHNSDDLEHFKAMTMGKTVVMGRKTYDSIPRPLTGRRSLILSKDPNFAPYWGEKADYMDVVASHDEDTWVIGGSAIYRLFLPHVDEIHRTLIFKNYQSDRSFLIPPDFDLVAAKPISTCTFQVWKRK